MTHVLDVVKLGLMSTSESAFAKRPILVTVQVVLMTTARMLRSRVLETRTHGFVAEAGAVTLPSTVT